MMSYRLKLVFYVLISAVLLVTLHADDEDCTVELKVRRNTIYKATLGEELRIECPFKLCNNSLQKFNWYKLSEKRVLLKVGNPTHFKTGWEKSNLYEGKYYLIFLSIGRSDFGEYQCESEGSVSHTLYINDTVGNKVANNSEKKTTTSYIDLTPEARPTSESAVAQEIYSHGLYRVIGIGAFFIIGISTCVTSQIVLKGRCRKTTDAHSQCSNQIYNNL